MLSRTTFKNVRSLLIPQARMVEFASKAPKYMYTGVCDPFLGGEWLGVRVLGSREVRFQFSGGSYGLNV